MDDYNMNQSAYFDGQHGHIMQPQPTPFGYSPIEHLTQSFSHWPTDNLGYQRPFYHPHLSTSTRSSASSNPRSSGNSLFSQLHNRASTVSTDSSWSNVSTLSRTHYLSQTEHSLTGNSSPLSSHVASPIDDLKPPPLRKCAVPRTSAQEKDHYTTCVSRKQRSRRSHTVQKYFCTSCKESFTEKADWKRHEETYQERFDEFQCDLCCAKYFLDKDFVTHHIKGHGCVSCDKNTKSTKCSEKKHVRESRTKRVARSNWGCGFCYHISNNWIERCNHIAHHFDHENKTMADWNHSAVIYSLLQRPEILREWNAILENETRVFVGFGWNPQSTARVEGFPDSNHTLQLQDALEYFVPGQDAAALARLAFDQAVRVERSPPPVPPKDYRVNHKASLQDMMKETESWRQFVDSIIDDEQFPTGVTHLEDGSLDDASGSWLDLSY
ncbi:hypothetical protein CC86DRAFT_365433 [Ophiobolus disseminans]|uniref:C2H2-type domain-containing protein n=1 Tax=Ophiobolus disseminans TaxID=1469910 RepID=A0A6A7ALH0_9PLEO|nr:hypothetical protein CC86DRAFT_365433 [Ophiobolus disseminans]